jgi:phage gpG-like protein
MIINLSLEAQEVLRSIQTMPQRLSIAMAAAMNDENKYTVGYIQERKLSQRGSTTLGVRSDRLWNSVRATKPVINGTSISSSIGTNVKYAAVHEFGTGPFTIRPKNKKALRFSVGGAFHFAKQVRHPGFPARRMFGSAIEEREAEYNKAMSKAITSTLQS